MRYIAAFVLSAVFSAVFSAACVTAGTKTCCKWCGEGEACGNSCIAAGKTCSKSPGCACNGYNPTGG